MLFFRSFKMGLDFFDSTLLFSSGVTGADFLNSLVGDECFDFGLSIGVGCFLACTSKLRLLYRLDEYNI